MVDDGRGDKTADEIARHVPGDVGGEGACRLRAAQALAHMGERQAEGGRHAEALDHAQRRKHREIGRERQQRRRDREQSKAYENAAAAVDVAAEQRDAEAGGGHAEGAGIDGEPHRGRRHLVVGGERGEQRLGGEEVDDGEERRQADHGIAADRARGRMVLEALSHCGCGRAAVHGDLALRDRLRPDPCACPRGEAGGGPALGRRGLHALLVRILGDVGRDENGRTVARVLPPVREPALLDGEVAGVVDDRHRAMA